MIPLIILAIEDPDDRQFMADLYLKYNRLMYSECIQILKDTWATEDVMQTAIERLIDKIPLLKTLSETKKINYIITTCRNLSKTYLKKKSRESGYEISESDGVDIGGNITEELVIQKQTMEIVGVVWASMDEQTKHLLQSKYILDKADAEIAEEIGINPNSVRTYLSRARSKMRKEIEKLEN